MASVRTLRSCTVCLARGAQQSWSLARAMLVVRRVETILVQQLEELRLSDTQGNLNQRYPECLGLTSQLFHLSSSEPVPSPLEMFRDAELCEGI